MTVSTTTNKVAYIGNGVATTFAIPFPFLEQEHLKVRQLLNNVQTERSDWTVSGGNMVFATAPANDAQIVIMREVPLTQETDYRENEILPAETLERNFDKLTMQVQQLKEQADRAVTVDIFDDTDAASLIPSIRQAVSDCAGYAATARSNAETATQQAQNAATSATNAGNSETHTAAMLGTKANVDADNFSTRGKGLLAGIGMPSNRYTDLTLGSNGVGYTAPANGYFSLLKGTTAAGQYINFNSYFGESTQHLCSMVFSPGTGYGVGGFIPVRKGDRIHISYTAAGTVTYFRFIYAEGDV